MSLAFHFQFIQLVLYLQGLEVVRIFLVVQSEIGIVPGDIEAKKSILLSMGAELEPLRGNMNTKDKDNEDLIFFMLNNMNLRHNNVTEGDSKYKEGVALMPEEELEGWYDELYQMMLLAFLQLDNKERIERVKELKKQICSK